MKADSISALGERHLVFRLDDLAYAVPIANVEEIVPMAELISVAGAPSFLAGFLDVGGQLVAVVSMRRLLAMPDRPRELYTPLVILKSTPLSIALEVDDVTQIVELDDSVSIAQGNSLNDCASAVARIDGRPVVLLAPERILLEQERRRLGELAESAQRRLAELDAELEKVAP
jgi:purine-binding chemotaxis protein CheW